MRQTLFVIPHAWLDGWPLILWLIVGTCVMVYLYLKHGSMKEVWGFLPVFALMAAALHFVIPQVEIAGLNPDDPTGPPIKIGLAMRGYGLFLLIGMLFGVSACVIRGRRIGISGDQILGLAFWMIVTGIVGARLFYIIQKWDSFGGSPQNLMVSLVDMTKGGLVVYGSLLGGIVAAMVYFWWNKLSPTKVADAIVPGMVLGLALGRIGCLMNGCCFGGVCSPDLPSLEFPGGSPPYMRQLSEGDLMGLSSKAILNEAGEKTAWREISDVAEDGLGKKFGIAANDKVLIQPPAAINVQGELNSGLPLNSQVLVTVQQTDQPERKFQFPLADLPDKSLGVHPTQVYSAINAALLFLFLWFYWPYRKSDGEVFALFLILYSIARFILESIRNDEAGLYGSAFTISQWVSFAAMAAGIGLLVWARSKNRIKVA